MPNQNVRFVDWLKALLIALIIVALVRQYLFANYIVNGESMMPTIEEGNRLIVNKIEVEIRSPERFDLIVFHANSEEDYIKRVIGLPGDTIKYENDQLYVNGKAVDEPYLDDFKTDLIDGQLTENFTLLDKTGRSTVPKDYYFVLGDNRRHSYDSRHIGFISKEEIVGIVNLRYWPIDRLQMNFY
ncbi:signal peptidase I [Pueribacillus sp. YX66]|uniref:signal peptidase I n=1 Tax=Pueribacillus sp. YX66 TaxID=3229242 RepID=UPI00358D2660